MVVSVVVVAAFGPLNLPSAQCTSTVDLLEPTEATTITGGTLAATTRGETDETTAASATAAAALPSSPPPPLPPPAAAAAAAAAAATSTTTTTPTTSHFFSRRTLEGALSCLEWMRRFEGAYGHPNITVGVIEYGNNGVPNVVRIADNNSSDNDNDNDKDNNDNDNNIGSWMNWLGKWVGRGSSDDSIKTGGDSGSDRSVNNGGGGGNADGGGGGGGGDVAAGVAAGGVGRGGGADSATPPLNIGIVATGQIQHGAILVRVPQHAVVGP